MARETDKNIKIKGEDLREFVDKVRQCVRDDIDDRNEHETKLASFYNRRFQQVNRNPKFPFVGCSNIVMPVIDMEVDKAKPPLMNVFNSDPIVTFKAMDAQSFEKTDAAELTMGWLLKTRMRDFLDNMEIGIDHQKMYGYQIIKTVYEYRTSIATETITKEQIAPEVLNDLAQGLAAVQTGQMTQEQFEEGFSAFILSHFNLHPDDDLDRKAAQKIMDFILKEEEEVVIKKREITHDAPYSYAVDPVLFIPESGTRNIQDAERITEIKFFTENDLMMRAMDGYFDEKEVKRAIEELNQPNQDKGDKVASKSTRMFVELETAKTDREGLNNFQNEGLVEVHEVYCLYDIDGDGVKEKCILIYQPDTSAVFRFMEYPYSHGEWPFVQIKNELTDDRFYSARGVPEIIDQIDELITQNHRNKQDRMKIANSPTFTYRIASGFNPNNQRWVPGQMVPVMEHGDFQAVQLPIIDASYDSEENILATWVDRRLGSIELSLRAGSSLSEPRTRAEILALQGVAQQALTLSISRYQRGMKKVYNQIWDLWLQYGPNEVIIQQSAGVIRKITRYQIQGNFDIDPVGTIGDSSPEQQFLRAQQRLQTLLSLMQAGALQLLGDQYELDMAAAFKDMMDKDDFIASSRILRRRTPEEIARIQQQKALQAQQQQAMQAAQSNVPMNVRDLQATLKQMKSEAPNGGAQQVEI